MANNKIREQDVIDKNVYKIGTNYARDIKKAIDANDKWAKSFLPLKKAALEYSKIESQFKQAKSRDAFIAAKKKEAKVTEQVTEATRAQKQAELNLIRTKERTKVATEGVGQALARERVAAQNVNKVNKEQAKIALGLVGPYQKLSAQLEKNRLNAKNLGVQFGENSKQFRAAQKEVLKTDNRLKSLDQALGQSQRYVGNYERSLRGLRGVFMQLTSALGLFGGAFAFIQIMRNGITIIRDFEKANATLSGILQVERSEMTGLTEDAKRLGETTVKSANEVTQLQIAYARLGFSQQEIIDLTGATIAGSIAMNAELDKTAELTGAVVNTFDDFSSTDAPEILDILSLSTAKSALNFEKLETAIPIVAGAANAANVPFTKLTALLGKLSDAGIDTSSSATALRNIFIEAAAQGLNYEEILEKIKNSQDKLTASNDEFGKRAAVSSAVLANNIDQTLELDLALQGAAGTAQRMADKELDTLDGALQLLKSAWQGVVLEVDEANGVTNKLKTSIFFLANNLKTIITILVRLAAVWIAYKTAVLATSIATRAYTAATVGLRIAKVALARGIRSATVALKLFNTASKGSGIGILVGVLAAGVTAFLAFKDGVRDTVAELKELKKAAEEARDETVNLNIASVKERLKQIDEIAKSEEEAMDKKTDLIKEEIKIRTEVTKDIDELLKDTSEDAVKREEEKNKKLEDLQSKLSDFQIEDIKKTAVERAKIQADAVRETTRIAQSETPLKTGFILDKTEREKTVEELEKLLQSLQDQKDKANAEAVKKQSEADRKAAEKRRKELAKNEYELQKFILEQRIKAQNETVEEEDALWFDRYTALSDRSDLEIELAQLTALRKFELTETFSEKEMEAFRANGELRNSIVKDLTAEELLIYLEYQAEKEEILKTGSSDEGGLDLEKLQRDAEEQKNIREKQLEDELRLENELFQRREGDYNGEINAVEALEKRKAEIRRQYAMEGLEAQMAAVETLLNSEEISAEKRAEYERELAEVKRDISDLNLEAFQEDDITRLEKAKETVDRIIEIEQRLSGAILSLSNVITERKIADLDEEIEKNNEKYERWLETENLTEEQEDEIRARKKEKEDKLKEEKRKEQKKQAVLQKAFAVFSIALSTAQAAMAALIGPPVGLGPVAGIPLAVATGVAGAVQIAAALAQPVPKYAMGTDNHPGGLAEVAEIRPEVIQEPGKAPYIQSTRAILDLPKGTKVTPSLEEYQDIKKKSYIESISTDTKKAKDFVNMQDFNSKFDAEILQELRLTRRAMEKTKTDVHVHERELGINHAIWRLKNLKWDS